MINVRIARIELCNVTVHDINGVLDEMEHALFTESLENTWMIVDTAHMGLEHLIPVEELDEICQHLEEFHSYYADSKPVRFSTPSGYFLADIPKDIHDVLHEVGMDSCGQVFFVHKDTPDVCYVVMQHK